MTPSIELKDRLSSGKKVAQVLLVLSNCERHARVDFLLFQQEHRSPQCLTSPMPAAMMVRLKECRGKAHTGSQLEYAFSIS